MDFSKINTVQNDFLPESAVGRLALWSVFAVIVLSPLASGMRGVNDLAGTILMALCDLTMLAIFFVSIANRNRNIFATLVFVFAIYAMFITTIAQPGQSWLVVSQGFRKTLLFPISIAVGLSIKAEDREGLHKAIIVSLAIICIYGIKQSLYLHDFDLRLLGAQSADLYTNMLNGKIRAFSFLSSGFHLGMSSAILVAYALWYKKGSLLWRAILLGVALWACYASLTRTFWLLAGGLVVLRAAQGGLGRWITVLYGSLLVLLLLELLSGGRVFASMFDLALDSRLMGRGASYLEFGAYFGDRVLGVIFGFGLGSAGSGLGMAFNQINAPWIEPHNIITKYLFELGVVFGSILILAIGTYIYRSIKHGADEKLLLIGLTAVVLVSGLFITSVEVWPTITYYGLLVGCYAKLEIDELRSTAKADPGILHPVR